MVSARRQICITAHGGAAHADDLRTIATTKNTIATQVNIIDNFTSKHSLRLNQDKMKLLKSPYNPINLRRFAINHLNTITTLPAAKCLGVWWSHNLSALRSVQENIIKARNAFFAFGSIQAFQGNLNPLSAISVFESCVLPILLYGCETWLLDSSTIQLLERFQLEIGRRILKLPKWFSGTVIRICLSLPSIVYRIFLCKIKYLSKLLVGDSKSISSRVFVSATIADPLDVSLIQQCKMLESIIGVSLVNQCLHSLDDALALISTSKGVFTWNPLLMRIQSPNSPKRIGSEFNAHRERSHAANWIRITRLFDFKKSTSRSS